MISVRHQGDFKITSEFFARAIDLETLAALNKYGRLGVASLQGNTPVDTGLTAQSWSYVIEKGFGGVSIYWTNTNINKGVSIAIILQYGHGTRNGGYVVGRDYINPAMVPIFEQLAEDLWRELTQ